MKSVKTIEIQDWMRTDETRALWCALNDDGKMQTLFVGGCVRNALLGAPVYDLDLATIHTPDDVINRLEAKHIRAIPTGIDHGTITAVINKKHFEITTLRKDVETDGRHAVIAFSTDWKEDAHRRDFTMNTLLCDVEGNIYDPTGQGIDDLDARNIRFVGNAQDRIAEDYLRILRYFRFHALYGAGEPDADILAACKAAASHIDDLSRERITQEMFKIIMVDSSVNGPADILGIMRDNKILPALFEHDGGNLERLAHVSHFQKEYGLGQLSCRLFTLAGLNLINAQSFDRYLIVPKLVLKDMKAMNAARAIGDLSCDHTLKCALYKCGRTATAQALVIALAYDELNNVEGAAALGIIKNWDIPNFPLSGDDLIAEGFESGPALGQELAKREQAWIERGFKD